MDSDTTIKAMLAVLNCKDIGNTASIFAALDIAKEFAQEFNRPTQHAPDKSGDSVIQSETVKSSNPPVESNPS